MSAPTAEATVRQGGGQSARCRCPEKGVSATTDVAVESNTDECYRVKYIKSKHTMETYHWHHIVPRHAGGTDDPSNLIKVTVEEHSELHLARYLEYGEKWDWIAAMALSGQISRAEASAEARREFTRLNPGHHSRAGQKGGKAPASEKTKKVAATLAQSLGKRPWWNNGLNNKRSYTCPGEGYVPGKLPCDTRSKQERVKCPYCELKCVPQNLSRHILSKHS